MKTIYLFNCNNKNEFLGTNEIQPQFDVYQNEIKFYEGYATDVEYPETEQNYVRTFNINTKTWSEPIISYRGQTIYFKANSLSKKTYWDIGEVPTGWTIIVPPSTTKNYKFDASTNEWIIPEIKTIPKKYSKLFIIRALKEIDLWNTVKETLIANDAWDEWEAATYLLEDDPMFIAMKTMLSTAYPDVNVDTILTKCLY